MKLIYICCTQPYWICWHHLNTNCHAMHYNSCFYKAHKAVFTVFAPAFMYVRWCDRVCLSRCAPGHAECTAMFISEYRCQARWTTWWESGITAICSSAACWAPKPLISHTHAVCKFVVQTCLIRQNSWSCDCTEKWCWNVWYVSLINIS